MEAPFAYYPTPHPWKPRPAEYVPGHGWYQNGQKLHNIKPHYHFIWPKDGKRGGTLGRWRDILENKGPDIHVTISADKNDHMVNRQRKSRWANWIHLDDRGPDGSLRQKPCWVRPFRHPGKSYDFRTRTYRTPTPTTWTDGLWRPGADDYDLPHAIRRVDGQWFQREDLL